MTYVIPDPRLEMPELFEPGRKPVGNVVIDTKHWAGQHCICAVVPSRGVAMDVRSNTILAPSSNAFVNSKGDIDIDGFNDKYTLNIPMPATDEFSIMIKFKRRSGGHDEGLVSDKNVSNWSSSAGLVLNMRATSGAALFKIGSSETYRLTDSSIAINTWITAQAFWKASDHQRYFLNGVEPSYTANNVAASYTESAINLRIGTYYDESATRTLDALIEYAFIFDRSFIEQRKSLEKDPYQMLIPA